MDRRKHGQQFPKAQVIVAMPPEPGEKGRGPVEQELILRGVAAERLRREPNGRNTREQALEVYRMLTGDGKNLPPPVIGLVTSPEHMNRAWKSFARAGFTRMIAMPGWSEPIKADLSYKENELGRVSLGGAVGENDMIKYRYWDNLGILIRCTRESVAWVYYKAMRWI